MLADATIPLQSAIAVTCVALVIGSVAARATEPRETVILRPSSSPGLADWSEALAHALRQRGVPVRLSGEDAFLQSLDGPANRAARDQKPDLIVPDLTRLPARCHYPLLRYLRSGASMIAFGDRPFQDPTVEHEGRWLSLVRYQAELAERGGPNSLLDFDTQPATAWRRATSNVGSEATIRFELEPDWPRGRAAHVHIANLTGWDTFRAPKLTKPIPQQDQVTYFWAKGGPRTKHLVLEWTEADGSRWIAPVELTTSWRPYALLNSQFSYWQDNPSSGRGGLGDKLRLHQAVTFTVGLAQSHAALPNGEHEFWIGQLSTGPKPSEHFDFKPPELEWLSPPHNHFALRDVWRLVVRPDQAVIGRCPELPAAAPAGAGIWRPRGLGLRVDLPTRWIPLLDAVDQTGQVRGTVASATIHFGNDGAGSVLTWIGINEPRWLESNRPALFDLVGQVLARLQCGIWLRAAGTDRQCFFENESAAAGAVICNFARQERVASLKITVVDASNNVVGKQHERVELKPLATVTVQKPLGSTRLRAGFYTTRAELRVPGRKGTLIDLIEHPFTVAADRPARAGKLVRVQDGRFVLDGRPWYPVGLNFWPSNSAGQNVVVYRRHWLSKGIYDPLVVERDLRLLADLGLNAIAIQYHRPDQADGLNDLLRRCDRYGIKVHTYLPGFDAVGWKPQTGIELIKSARLSQAEALFSYELAWEAHLGRQQRRRLIDPYWRAWIVERYGSIANAESTWNLQPPHYEGRPTAPSDEQLLDQGPWRRMVAAYRRFVDDFVNERYRQARHLIRAADPNHLITVRNGYGGTGQPWPDPHFPLDLGSGAKHLDFLCPEGWGLKGELDNYLQAGFTTQYARLVSGGKPVVWIEFGMNIWPHNRHESYLTEQDTTYRNMMEMVWRSGASGAFGWWFPGGYRVDEKSDYGVVDPDGRPRPAIETLARYARKLGQPHPRSDLQAETSVRSTAVIVIDRDKHPRGYSAVWLRHRDEYLRLLKQGQPPALAFAEGELRSTDPYQPAIGGGAAAANNPPKHLNAEITAVGINVSGKPHKIEPDHILHVPRSSVAELRVHAGNIGPATWVAPVVPAGTDALSRPVANAVAQPEQSERGTVWLALIIDGNPTLKAPLPVDVPFLSDCVFGPLRLPRMKPGSHELKLGLEAHEVVRFGATFGFRLAIAGKNTSASERAHRSRGTRRR